MVPGIAWGFIFWILPIIKLNRNPNNAASQLVETSHRGGLWLEPINASLAALSAFLSILLRYHPDPTQAATWKFYAAASLTLVQVAWWERVFIFPLDRAMTAVSSLGNARKELPVGDSQNVELASLHRSMDRWGMYHTVRAALPLAAAMVALAGKLRL